MDLMERSEIQQKATAYRARPFDCTMPPLTVETIDNDGVVRLYEAVIALAKHDYVMYKKRLLMGFHDKSIKTQKHKKTYATNKCQEILEYFAYMGVKGDRLDTLVSKLDAEAIAWWNEYKAKEQAKAAKEWLALGRCLDD